MRRLFAPALIVAACSWTADARADAHDDANRVFREGRALYDARDYAAACERFAESQRLEPAAGTLLNLADCYERVGRVASAWSAYKEAAAAAALRKRRDWERFAKTRIDALAPMVPMLAIRVSAAARAPGLVVTRNGDVVPANDLDREVPVDPGKQVIAASAPDRDPWTTSIDVARGRAYVVEITPTGLKETARPAPPPAPPLPTAEPSDERAWQRPVGFATGGVGIAAIAFGAIAGGVAMGARSDAVSKCPSYPTACTADGTAANERAFGWATTSTVALIAGGVLTAAGVVLVVTAPRVAPARIEVSPIGAVNLSVAF